LKLNNTKKTNPFGETSIPFSFKSRMFISIEYCLVLFFGCLGFAVGIVLPSLTWLTSLVWLKKKNNSLLVGDAEKTSTYECGFEPFSNPRNTFDIHFYLVCLLFIIFDLEIVFLLPWALTYSFLTVSSFFIVLVFLTLLLFGFVFEWIKGALSW